MPTVDPADEARHTPGDDPLWNESIYLDWFTEDLSLGGYVRVGLYPNLGTVWYWACLVEPGRPLVTVIDHEVPMPSSDRSWELRHAGLWADHIVEDPLEHVSCNLEAFAVSLEDPAEVYRGGWGDRVPFGFELDWFTDRSAFGWPPLTPRYEIPCRVHGRVLVGDQEIEIDGWGQRDHSWGAPRAWWSFSWNWSAGRLNDGTRFHTAGAFSGLGDLGVGYVLPAGSEDFTEVDEVECRAETGREGFVERAGLRFAGQDLTITPLAYSPVLLAASDGRESRFPRALARVDAADGRSGGAWIEWNQPQG